MAQNFKFLPFFKSKARLHKDIPLKIRKNNLKNFKLSKMISDIIMLDFPLCPEVEIVVDFAFLVVVVVLVVVGFVVVVVEVVVVFFRIKSLSLISEISSFAFSFFRNFSGGNSFILKAVLYNDITMNF